MWTTNIRGVGPGTAASCPFTAATTADRVELVVPEHAVTGELPVRRIALIVFFGCAAILLSSAVAQILYAVF